MIKGIPYSVWWLMIAIVFGVIEILTLNLVTIWFIIGALFAMFFSLLGLPILCQVIVFIIASSVLMILTKPIIKNFLKLKPERTNADKVLGEKGLVIEEIDFMKGTGQVKINGQIWTAISVNKRKIDINEIVEVQEISGVKLIVKKIIKEEM